jgi:hypothetical protein
MEPGYREMNEDGLSITMAGNYPAEIWSNIPELA